MNNFWNNIFRYPRFFISSVIGLVLVIITPVRNLLKIEKFQFIIFLLFLLSIIVFYATIKSMVGL